MIDRDRLLQTAKEHCFFIGLHDSGAELCRANAVYGIAGLHCVQKQLGFSQNATFMSTPDMTITRNISRWQSGFGYGGKVSWGDGNDDLVILNVKPNACGMLIGGLKELPEVETLIKKIHDLESSQITIDGIKVKWDFYKSNHFIDLCQVTPVVRTDIDLPPYAFIMHGSAEEFKADNPTGFGLYHDKSRQLQRIAEKINTPFHDFYVLTGDSARKYFNKYLYVENFSKKKRELAAGMIFGDYLKISNEIHQGLINMNEIILGCHHISNSSTLFPITLRGDLPAYLVKGVPNLNPEVIEVLGFEKRAKKLGVYNRITNLNIIPHGGGYVLPDILTVNKVIEINGKRYFNVEMQNDRGCKIISEVRELPYEYRGRTVVLRALELGLIEIVAKMIPQYVLKI